MTATATRLDAPAIEIAWCSWISRLRPWERRVVFAHELDWHDRFASQQWGWQELNAALAEQLR